MEAAVLDALQYRMTVATPMSFLPRFFKAAGVDGDVSALDDVHPRRRQQELTRYLMELTQQECVAP